MNQYGNYFQRPQKRHHYEQEWPSPYEINRPSTNGNSQLPPVIISLADGKPNFKDMKIAERDAVNKDIVAAVGPVRDSLIPRGGELFVFPTDERQKDSSKMYPPKIRL